MLLLLFNASRFFILFYDEIYDLFYCVYMILCMISNYDSISCCYFCILFVAGLVGVVCHGELFYCVCEYFIFIFTIYGIVDITNDTNTVE